VSIEITIGENGPIRVTGENIVIKDAAGNVYDIGGRTRVSLCRCGESQNKPFCDGAHKTCAFEAKSAAFALPPAPPRP
jgi:CDGSH-type Zn-finger protein